MAQNVCQYIESEIFDNIPYNQTTFTIELYTGSTTLPQQSWEQQSWSSKFDGKGWSVNTARNFMS